MSLSACEFVPYEGDYVDFYITTEDTAALSDMLMSLGARRFLREGHTIYVWYDSLPATLFLGSGVVGGKFRKGPQGISGQTIDYGAGAYAVIESGQRASKVVPDPFGMHVIYASETCVTNRLHLAALTGRALDYGSAFSSTYANHMFSYQFAVFDTPVSGVRMLAAGDIVRIADVITVKSNNTASFGVASPTEYWKLIDAGVREIVGNVNAVVDSGYPVICDLSGGRDSRLLLAALIVSGRVSDVAFNTHTNDPSRSSDLDIATGLVREFGGNYQQSSPVMGYAVEEVSSAFLRRRSQLFGSYHYIVKSELNQVVPIARSNSVRMLGGCGELYRDYYQTFFASVSPGRLPTAYRGHRL